MADTETTRDDLLKPEQGSVAGDRLFTTYQDFFSMSAPLEKVTPKRVEAMLALDGKIRSVGQALTLPVHSVPWTVDGEGKPAEAIRDDLARLDPPFEQVLAELAGASLYGHSTHELTFEERDGRVALARIALRPQSSTTPKVNDRTGAIEGFVQRVRRDNTTKKIEVSDARSLVVLHNRHRRPLTGVSDLECAWALFEHRQKVKYLYFDFLENQSLPKAIGEHSNNDAGQQQQFARQIATLRGGGALVHGPDQNIKPYESSGRGAGEFREAIDQLGREVCDSVLAGFLNLSAGEGGSYALSRDQSDLFLQSRQAILQENQGALMAQVFRRLTAVNFGVGVPVPVFAFGKLAREHVADAFALLLSLAADVPEKERVSLASRLGVRVAGLLDLPAEDSAR